MRENDAVWSERVQQCRTSGLPDHIWCIENGIAVSTFYYHVRKLRENACEVPAPKAAVCQEKQEVVPVEWGRTADSPDDSMPLGRKLPENQTVMKISAGSILLEIQEGISADLLRAAFQMLQELC